MFARFNGTMTESESSNTYIAGYEHSFFPSRPGLCVLGMLEASQVPWVDVRTCMGSWTPRSLSALTNTDGLVLPSTTGTVSALRKSAISSLISPAHAHRYRRFAHPLAGTDARLAAKVARYTFLSAGLAPAVHARVSLAHPRELVLEIGPKKNFPSRTSPAPRPAQSIECRLRGCATRMDLEIMVLSSILRHASRERAWTGRVPCGRDSEFRNGSKNGVSCRSGDVQFETFHWAIVNSRS